MRCNPSSLRLCSRAAPLSKRPYWTGLQAISHLIQQFSVAPPVRIMTLTTNGISNGNSRGLHSTAPSSATPAPPTANGDLNNVSSMREVKKFPVQVGYAFKSLAIAEADDDAKVRNEYRPFILDEETTRTDWISKLELSTVCRMAEEDMSKTGERLKVLVLYGSLRKRSVVELLLETSADQHSARSYSKLLAYEISRILFRLGCDVRIYDPRELPMKDDELHDHPKVQELRALSRWSDGHFWVSPEQHGTLVRLGLGILEWLTTDNAQTAVFKNQIDWIPLSTGSVRPTQGRTLGLAMVSGGSQSFNTVNNLRILGRWMRMFAIPNQSSVPMAYKLFTPEDGPESGSRMMEGGNRDRVVDCVEEFVKYTILVRANFDLFSDRFSEREEYMRDEVNGVKLGSI